MQLILTRLSKHSTMRILCSKLQHRTCSSSSNIASSSSTSSNFGFDPYEYTSGRWLRADAAQRNARRVNFNFPALCQEVIRSVPGAKEILECSKVEGNFNRAFVMRLDNGTKVVARVPFSVAGPSRLATNSEVATMAYVREKTDIPIPRVLCWNHDASDSVGAEYIIMQHVSGVQLQQQWPGMNGLQRLKCVQNLGNLVKQMHDLEFPAYGSIYFNDPLQLLLSPSESVPLGTRFCIGPSLGLRYLPCHPTDRRYYDRIPPNCGPFETFDDFTRSLLDAGVSRIPDETPPTRPAFRGTAKEHLALLSETKAVLKALSRDPRVENISAPLLLHPDLHKRNIFLDPEDPATITGIIDWQSTSLDPALLYFDQVPDLCEHPGGKAHDAMDSYNVAQVQMEEQAEREDNMLRREVAILRMAWELGLEASSPKLYAAQTLGSTLLRPFRYCSTTWQHGLCGLRSDLMSLCQDWIALSLPGSCPYQPTEEELAMHNAQWEDFESAIKLEKGLMNILSTNEEGFVHAENWVVVKEAADALFEKWLSQAITDEMSLEKAKQLWPYDN